MSYYVGQCGRSARILNGKQTESNINTERLGVKITLDLCGWRQALGTRVGEAEEEVTFSWRVREAKFFNQAYQKRGWWKESLLVPVKKKWKGLEEVADSLGCPLDSVLCGFRNAFSSPHMWLSYCATRTSSILSTRKVRSASQRKNKIGNLF